MSGVEIAGLTLGVLPLIISAVENYRVTLRPIISTAVIARSFVTFAQPLRPKSSFSRATVS